MCGGNRPTGAAVGDEMKVGAGEVGDGRSVGSQRLRVKGLREKITVHRRPLVAPVNPYILPLDEKVCDTPCEIRCNGALSFVQYLFLLSKVSSSKLIYEKKN